MGNTQQARNEPPLEIRDLVLGKECSTRKLLENLAEGRYQNVVVMCGAGISVSCGIPDFRTPGTGLYDNLQKYNLSTPESVFDIKYFRENKGEAFYKLAKEMWPDNFKPSPAHCFLRLLHDKGYLKRCFTQNIDTLERAVGIPDDRLVEAHGSFASAGCIKCQTPADHDKVREQILSGRNLPIRCTQAGCGGLVKPDIVFFGEGLPSKFQLCRSMDMPEADLLIIMGTSLQVQPFAGLVEDCRGDVPRLLLNLKPVGLRVPSMDSDGLRLRQLENYRDVMIEGTCDDSVRAICDFLGWRDDLEDLVVEMQSRVGSSRSPIDVTEAFPTMVPDGLAYNWRAASKEVVLPPAMEALMRSEDFEIDELEQCALLSPSGAAMFYLEEYTELKRNGTFGAMLCLTGKAHSEWEMTHSLAIVSAKEMSLSISSIQHAEILQQPMTKSGEDGEGDGVSFHQVAIDIPGEEGYDPFFVWYVDTTKGRVTHRWGPFSFSDSLKQKQEEDGETTELTEEEKQILEDLGGDEGLQEIMQAFGAVPEHLQPPSQ